MSTTIATPSSTVLEGASSGNRGNEKTNGYHVAEDEAAKGPKTESYFLPEKDLFGPITKAKAYRGFAYYVATVVLGTGFWAYSGSAFYRLLGAGLMFPGGGFLALGKWWTILFPIWAVLFPISLFGWFWVGNLLLPYLAYFGSAFLAAWIGTSRSASSVFSLTPYISWFLAAGVVGWWLKGIQEMGTSMEKLRQERNIYINAQVASEAGKTEAAIQDFTPGQRELSPKQIQSMRFLMNLCRQPLDSWKGFTHQEQFRESALRYQLYHIVYGLSMIQSNITPNFHGELSRVQRMALEKVLTPDVLYYWMWESLWGRFSLKWDPVEKENIMLTGWYLLALMMYTATTGDQRYTKKDSLVFRTTSWLKYPHSIKTIADALMRNWGESPFCLYACEPNWIYTICNLYGMTGSIIYDRVFGTDNIKKILPRFTKMWDAEFMNRDGLVVPVRSGLIGVQLPVGGATVFAGTSFQVGPLYPKNSDQLWAIFTKEFVKRNSEGKVVGMRLEGTDYIDPGSFAYSEDFVAAKAWIVMSATERGDRDLADFLEKDIRKCSKTLSDGCGGTYISTLSGFSNIALATGLFSGPEDFRNAVNVGPPKHTFEGPLLAEAPYPEVVVAKAWSHDGKNLDLVLYPGTAGRIVRVQLGLERLTRGGRYLLKEGSGETAFTADGLGTATIEVTAEGRTPVFIKPAGN